MISTALVRALTAGAALLALLSPLGPGLVAQRAATTVILVRHGEKEATPAADPPLSTAGQARARALLDALRGAHVSAVITTQFARTRETAAPTASAFGITSEIVPTTTGAAHVKDVAVAIRKHAGQTVLVVGHSNTVTEIVAALGAPKPPAICDSEYDNLYVVTIAGDGAASVVHARFGAPTPVETGTACAAMR